MMGISMWKDCVSSFFDKMFLSTRLTDCHSHTFCVLNQANVARSLEL